MSREQGRLGPVRELKDKEWAGSNWDRNGQGIDQKQGGLEWAGSNWDRNWHGMGMELEEVDTARNWRGTRRLGTVWSNWDRDGHGMGGDRYG
jgi:hypothetical protein